MRSYTEITPGITRNWEKFGGTVEGNPGTVQGNPGTIWGNPGTIWGSPGTEWNCLGLPSCTYIINADHWVFCTTIHVLYNPWVLNYP